MRRNAHVLLQTQTLKPTLCSNQLSRFWIYQLCNVSSVCVLTGLQTLRTTCVVTLATKCGYSRRGGDALSRQLTIVRTGLHSSCACRKTSCTACKLLFRKAVLKQNWIQLVIQESCDRDSTIQKQGQDVTPCRCNYRTLIVCRLKGLAGVRLWLQACDRLCCAVTLTRPT